jgi:integrase
LRGEGSAARKESILAIQKLKLTNEEWKSARDIFCFMYWRGQRFSDYLNIKHSDFSFNERGEKVWKLVAEKTQKPILVPMVDYAEKILLKYKKAEFPIPRLTNDKMNEYLKEIGKEAKLDHSVKHVSYYDGKKEEESFPFYDVLTSHVARKSFITNSLILGIPERVVRDISGHTDEKSFRRYVFLADTYKSQLINKAFSTKNISKHLKTA